MSTTTTTTTTTTMMASNDIPSSNEVVRAAATGDAGATSLPALASWSLFVFGERKDRVLKVFSDMTLTVPNNFVSLSTDRWACLMSVRDKINAVIEEIKRYNR